MINCVREENLSPTQHQQIIIHLECDLPHYFFAFNKERKLLK